MKLKLTTLVTTLILSNIASAATAIDLKHQSPNLLQTTLTKDMSSHNQARLQPTRADVDFNQTTHTRLQQVYAGVPVWNATAVLHTPKTTTSPTTKSLLGAINNSSTMNGVMYEGLEKDLAGTPSYALTDAQKANALQTAKTAYAKVNPQSQIDYKEETNKTIVFVDDKNVAHYAYLISFYIDDGKTGAHRPTMIIDATSLHIYRSWDQVKTADHPPVISTVPEVAIAGGIGGNEKIGEVIYDGDKNHQRSLSIINYKTDIEVLPGQKIMFSLCSMSTPEIEVQDVSYASDPVQQLCYIMPGQHNNVNWLSWDRNGTRWKSDQANGSFSPSLDAYYGATIVKEMYQNWYKVPVLTLEDGKTPMKLIMRVHYGRKFENAFWDGKQMTFGDGDKMFYPLTSLDVTAHEISHGFTNQHSNIDGDSYLAMGALHEAFSDMAAAAAQFYVNGKNTWEMGRDITKGEGALRYMNEPTKDGQSIDHMKDLNSDIDVHLAAGIYNKAFYLIATTKGWDTHKAFNVMVKANMDYWTSSMKTFDEAACGVVSATKDYNYNLADVRIAFAKVGIDTDKC
jgi:pseudolysin